MFLEQKLAGHLSQLASSDPTDTNCQSQFKDNQSRAFAGVLFGTAVMGYFAVHPRLLLANPPRAVAFGAQVALVSGLSILSTFWATRFTSIQCISCFVASPGNVGDEARKLVSSMDVQKEAFWELARQLVEREKNEERKVWLEAQRVKWGVKRMGEKNKEGKI